MTDAEFVRAFETCTLPEDQFHHRDHIRLAWIYCRDHGEIGAQLRIRESIQRFATHLGKSDRYHETITIAWLRLVAEAQSKAPLATFEQMTAVWPQLLDKNHLVEFYSDDLLKSDTARASFVEPDKKPLPMPAPDSAHVVK